MTVSAPFYLYQFGTTLIPGAQGRFVWPLEADASPGVQTLGGYYDPQGRDTGGIKLPAPLSYTGLAVHASDTTQIRIALDGLRGLVNRYDRLWLKTTDGADRWAWARLLAVPPEITATGRATVPFTMLFQVQSIWNGTGHGGAWNLDSGYYFDNGLFFNQYDEITSLTNTTMTVTTTNYGNRQVDNAGITIVNGAVPLTYIRISVTGASYLRWQGTLAANKTLIFDCGACTILNDGLDAWSGVIRSEYQVIKPWLRIQPGANSIEVFRTGGNGDTTFTLTYSDGWS